MKTVLDIFSSYQAFCTFENTNHLAISPYIVHVQNHLVSKLEAVFISSALDAVRYVLATAP